MILLQITLLGNEEYPTLVHFSAKYGLEKLTLKLLHSPGGDVACQLRNSSHCTPIEMAEMANHKKLANILRRHKVIYVCKFYYCAR